MPKGMVPAKKLNNFFLKSFDEESFTKAGRDACNVFGGEQACIDDPAKMEKVITAWIATQTTIKTQRNISKALHLIGRRAKVTDRLPEETLPAKMNRAALSAAMAPVLCTLLRLGGSMDNLLPVPSKNKKGAAYRRAVEQIKAAVDGAASTDDEAPAGLSPSLAPSSKRSSRKSSRKKDRQTPPSSPRTPFFSPSPSQEATKGDSSKKSHQASNPLLRSRTPSPLPRARRHRGSSSRKKKKSKATTSKKSTKKKKKKKESDKPLVISPASSPSMSRGRAGERERRRALQRKHEELSEDSAPSTSRSPSKRRKTGGSASYASELSGLPLPTAEGMLPTLDMPLVAGQTSRPSRRRSSTDSDAVCVELTREKVFLGCRPGCS
jgi:hypothetical protein